MEHRWSRWPTLTADAWAAQMVIGREVAMDHVGFAPSVVSPSPLQTAYRIWRTLATIVTRYRQASQPVSTDLLVQQLEAYERYVRLIPASPQPVVCDRCGDPLDLFPLTQMNWRFCELASGVPRLEFCCERCHRWVPQRLQAAPAWHG